MDTKNIRRPLAFKTSAAEGIFSGYASVFGELDHYNEIVAKGAFARTLAAWKEQGRSPAMLWMHDASQPIGVWTSLCEDRNGLAVEGRLALSTQKGGEACELLRMGALTGLSIGYRVVSSRVDSARRARVLTEIELFEISLVTFPANEAARVDGIKSPPAAKVSDGEATRAIVARLRKAARVLQQTGNHRGER